MGEGRRDTLPHTHTYTHTYTHARQLTPVMSREEGSGDDTSQKSEEMRTGVGIRQHSTFTQRGREGAERSPSATLIPPKGQMRMETFPRSKEEKPRSRRAMPVCVCVDTSLKILLHTPVLTYIKAAHGRP